MSSGSKTKITPTLKLDLVKSKTDLSLLDIKNMINKQNQDPALAINKSKTQDGGEIPDINSSQQPETSNNILNKLKVIMRGASEQLIINQLETEEKFTQNLNQ